MIFNTNKKRKRAVLEFFNYLDTEVLPKSFDSAVKLSLKATYQTGLDLIDKNEWGIAFENMGNELAEHYIILDRQGIEIAKKVTSLCKLDPEWEFKLRRILSLGYKPGSWQLLNADAIAEQHKYTFYKPSQNITDQLRVGNAAKVIFNFDSSNEDHPSAERMWIEITEVQNNKFVGRLDNDPFYIHDLFAGDLIEFEHKHIIDHDLDISESSLVGKYSDRCFVTSKVLYENHKVRYLYREQPQEKDPERDYEDTGWRIMAGDETDEYMDNSENIHLVSLGAVLTRDDSFIDLLDAPIGSAFQKNEGGKFEPAQRN